MQRFVGLALAPDATGVAIAMLMAGRYRYAFGCVRIMVIAVASFFCLVRIHAGLTAVALAVVAAMLTRAALEPRVVVAAAAAVLFATSAGNALNDVYDCKIDNLNRPGRPIPTGRISPGAAKSMAATMFALAVAFCAYISVWCLAIGVANVVILIVYAIRSKTLGLGKNFLVGALVGSVPLFGATEPGLINSAIATLGACALLTTVAREIMKDVEDKSGDACWGARTLPIATSDGIAYSVAYACLAAALALAFIPYLLSEMNNTYAMLVALGGMLFFGSAFASRARERQLIVMAGSVLQLSAFYFGHAHIA